MISSDQISGMKLAADVVVTLFAGENAVAMLILLKNQLVTLLDPLDTPT
jgi:hypothetical protein